LVDIKRKQLIDTGTNGRTILRWIWKIMYDYWFLYILIFKFLERDGKTKYSKLNGNKYSQI